MVSDGSVTVSGQVQTRLAGGVGVVVCGGVVPHAADHASLEKPTPTEINDALAPGRNAGSAQPRYWDSQHSGTAPDDGDDPFFYLLRCQLVDLLHPNFIARCAPLCPLPFPLLAAGH